MRVGQGSGRDAKRADGRPGGAGRDGGLRRRPARAGEGRAAAFALAVTLLLGGVLPFAPSRAARAATADLGWQGTSVGASLSGVAYGGGVYVAVGSMCFDSGTACLFTSSDGLHWTERSLPGTVDPDAALFAVTYGDGRFVAVGDTGTIVTSDDGGATWTDRSLSGVLHPPFFEAVTYGDGRFVAVGSDTSGPVVYTSSDGSTWSPAGAPAGGVTELMGVAYGEGLYVAAAVYSGAGEGGGAIATTTDPTTVAWSVYVPPGAGALRAVTYGGGRFVAVDASGRTYTSPDGHKDWTPADTAAAGLRGVAYGGGLFVAGGYGLSPTFFSEDRVCASQDATSWTCTWLGTADTFTGVAFGGRFVLVGSDGHIFASATIGDVTPPTWPGGASLGVEVLGPTSVSLSWPPARDDEGIVAYDVYRDGTRVATVSGSVYAETVTGLAHDTWYTFEVRARDAAGNASTGLMATVRTARSPVPPSKGPAATCAGGGASPPAFRDVPTEHRAYASIGALACRGVVAGFPDGTFRPDDPVTRAQFVKMLVLALGLAPRHEAAPFADVPDDAWYAPYVAAAARAAFARGLSPAVFAPERALTREEMATLLTRAAGLRGEAPLAVADAAAVDEWARAGVAAALAAGYMEVFPDGTFRPRSATTRAQAAELLASVLGLAR